MATSMDGLKLWQGRLQGLEPCSSELKAGERKSITGCTGTWQKLERCFLSRHPGRRKQHQECRKGSLPQSGRISRFGSRLCPRFRSRLEGSKSTRASLFAGKENKCRANKEAQNSSRIEHIFQGVKGVLMLTPQRKSFVLLNVLAFIDGATAVVIKATELNTGSEEDPAAGTSLMFLVRFLVGLLAFAPALSQQFRSETEAAAVKSTLPSSHKLPPMQAVPVLIHSKDEPLAAVMTAGTSADWESEISGGLFTPQGLESEQGGVNEGQKESTWETLYWPGMVSGVFMFLGDAGQALGLETSTADHAAVLLTGSVILVPFLEAFSGRKIGVPVWLSALLATAGMVLLEQGSAITSALSDGSWGSTPTLLLPSIPIGDVWCLTSSIAFALYMVLSERQCMRTDPLKLAAVQLATTVVLSVLWEAWDLHYNGGGSGGALLLRHLAAMPWAAVLFVGVIGTGLASWMELQALQTVNPTTATLVYTTGPLWSAILAYLALGETMDAVSCGGAALILLASIGTQVFAPPKILRTSRALIQPLSPKVRNKSVVRVEGKVGKHVEEKSVVSTPVDTFVEVLHKVAEGPAGRSGLKLLPVRAFAEKPRLLSRKEIVPRLWKLFHHIRR